MSMDLFGEAEADGYARGRETGFAEGWIAGQERMRANCICALQARQFRGSIVAEAFRVLRELPIEDAPEQQP